jgi:hypothetical protein
MTTTNQQVKLLMKKLKRYPQEIAAAKAGMDVKTARKYIKMGELPSDSKSVYKRNQASIFAAHWEEISQMLERSPGLQAQTLMSYLVQKYPSAYKLGQVRTLQRHIYNWRAEHGASQSVIFRQDIQPGRQSQSDYTCMNALNIKISGQEFRHLLFHFMLPYSRWESIYLCFSETFESLTLGYEKAVWELGCVALEHRTDNLTAATQTLGGHREFTDRYRQFMGHYSVTPTTNNIGVSHENGSVEKSHDILKNAVAQEMMLRGGTDFASQKDYLAFVEKIVSLRNAKRQERLLLEMDYLSELPDKKWHSPTVIHVRVSSGSIVQILDVPYTVPSRLIHYTLKAYVYPDEIILFYGNKKLQTMPRLRERSLGGINYRHLIDSLIRKPAAFAHYQYHEALFPRLCFRKAYLKLLQMAKLYSEQEVAEALNLLLEEHQMPDAQTVKTLIDACLKTPLNVHVHQVAAADYDCLLSPVFGKGVH